MSYLKILTFFILCITDFVSSENLKIRIVDANTKELVAARVLILNSEGESLIPTESFTLQIGSEVWFISPGYSEIETHSENITLRVERGKEYLRIKKDIDLSKFPEHELEIEMERWINMKSYGYLSSENHIHLPAEEVAAMCAAEDLNFGTSLQWWNHPRFGVPSGKSNVLDLKFANESIPVSIYDVEVEESWGALYIINMPTPFPFLNDEAMPNIIVAKYAAEKDALNCYQGGWSREVLVDALLGFVDVVNVCNNNFHMHRYQPRSHYSNLLEVDGLPIYRNTPDEMMKMNTDTYYRLLNCGLKLATGAGSAIGAKETPLGYNRSYVRLGENQSWDEFVQNWKDGKNFVTNGPMIFMKSSDGYMPGDEINISNGYVTTLEVEVISDSPIKTLELVANGKVIKSFNVENASKKFIGNFNLEVDSSTWICARCTDTDVLLDNEELETYRSARVNLYQDPNRLRYAHTSPIYFYLDGKDIVVEKSVKEGIKIIDAFEKFAIANSSSKYLKIILAATKEARDILINKLNN